MKFALIQKKGVTVVALHHKDRWIDVTSGWHDRQEILERIDGERFCSIEQMMSRKKLNPDFIERLEDFLEKPGMEPKYLLEEPLHFLQPIRPGKIIAIGRNYDAHARELGNEPPKEVLYFAKTPSICIGPEMPIVTRPAYGRVDYEGELGVIIGRHAKDVSEDEARDCIAGYTIVNDVTAREMQKRDIAQGHPWYRSKNIDTFCPIGPVVALPDALSWPLEITVETRVNGEIRQHGNTRDFIFPLPRLISYVSSFMALEPGDLIATGTPEGVGPIQPGDVVEVSIEGIGTLRNPVR